MLLDITVGNVTRTDYHMQVGDLNGDGRLDSADAVILLRMLAGLPINPDDARKSAAFDLKNTSRTLLLHDKAVREEEQFNLPVYLDDIQQIAGGDLLFSWAHDALRFDEARMLGVFADMDYEVQAQPGYVRISFADEDSQNKSTGGALVELTFTVLAKPTTAMNPAPEIRANYADLKLAFGESILWFGDIELGSATITVLPKSGGEGEGEGEGEDQDDEKSPAICGSTKSTGGNSMGTMLLMAALLAMLGATSRRRA